MNQDGYLFCDRCGSAIGHLWNEPVVAPALLPEPNRHLCPDCIELTELNDVEDE
ncbi:hypothetical protein [Pseudomonas nitroreducens]|uniref:hypothetical protein n=1 Tax=Pseudomonas nitroreducens TaxID=46680 RepID=UPI0026597213|nr:hypothetical protein [Pseudomonas nitroreducens]MCP1649421.1 hypothetical protein [Pseudomonas nitroreducens]MCP1684618.1 hypothetical protein [Pseudomonas nitroreducens]